MLKLSHITAGYGPVKVLDSVSLEIHEGEIVSIIGANGAGKSTTMRVISGNIKQDEGDITFLGENINHVPVHKRVELGIVQVPEGRQIFGSLTVLENLTLGFFSKRKEKALFNERLTYVYDLFPKLKERKQQKAGSLSGGEQQMLAIGRALISDPKLLLLDEPSLVLSPLIVGQIFEVLTRLNDEGLTILIVEQNVYETLSISDRTYLLENGEIIREGKSADLIKDPSVMEAYLGQEVSV